MILTFENNNDIIVYAVEKIISYARENRYIFVAQSIWWIVSVIGLTEGLVVYIDNPWLREIKESVGTSVDDQLDTKAITTSPDIEDRLNINSEGSRIHPDRISQVDNTINYNYKFEHSDSELGWATGIVKETKEFVSQSQKERKKIFQRKPDPLSRT